MIVGSIQAVVEYTKPSVNYETIHFILDVQLIQLKQYLFYDTHPNNKTENFFETTKTSLGPYEKWKTLQLSLWSIH